MTAIAAVRTAVYFRCLGIAVLFLAFCSDMMQFPSVMADVIHVKMSRMSFRQADILDYHLKQIEQVKEVKVYERTADAVVCYAGNRDALLRALTKTFLPAPVRSALAVIRALPYIRRGLDSLRRRKMEVAVLDATAIGVSLVRGDFATASSVMFLLGIGELLEEWTRKKSVGDLARTLSFRGDQVWLARDGQEILVPVSRIQRDDCVIVRMGNLIPFDGTVEDGEGLVNQASLTGESLPVRRTAGDSVYAGTVLEEGELFVRVREATGSGRFEKIVAMIEESEKLKSSAEGRAEHLADRLVPYTLGGTLMVYGLTRNATRALSVLMVDFSCALKLAMPVSVLSAIREASQYNITVKGGKFLEKVAEADTIVFDKTGTLTKARPTVARVVPFNGESENELLRLAACLEEHFPHSMAKAVVQAAEQRELEHKEMHSKVEYVVAHGISSTVDGKKVRIGSYHFIFEDEKCALPPGKEALFDSLPAEHSHLYLAIENRLAAVICIADPLRPEAASCVRTLKENGIRHTVMMTGDSLQTARRIAELVGVDEFYAEVLPEDKARFVERARRDGHSVIMVGDGINDSPALSAADVGIAIRDGAELAREIADITIRADDLEQLVTLKALGNGLMRRIGQNYRWIVGFNTGLIVLGVLGILPPATSALFHNTSTLAIGLHSMQNLLPY